MQNFSLLRRVGKSHLPVLLKRGLSATLDEWLLAAEYIMSEGNYQVILCERGIRTFAQHTRNTMDLAAIPAVRSISHLPVIVDPSHGTGKNFMVTPLARAGVAVGADGLIVEVHDQPDHALSDGASPLFLLHMRSRTAKWACPRSSFHIDKSGFQSVTQAATRAEDPLEVNNNLSLLAQ